MRYAKITLFLFLFVLLMLQAFKVISYATLMLVLFVPVSVLLFNIAVRKRLSMKSFLLHPANILTSKLHQSFVVDMPAELLFEKMKEVIADGKFKLVATDTDSYALLATVPMSVWSWGENIYITIVPQQDQSRVDVSSVAFQMYAWGRNEAHFKNIVENLEDSLII